MISHVYQSHIYIYIYIFRNSIYNYIMYLRYSICNCNWGSTMFNIFFFLHLLAKFWDLIVLWRFFYWPMASWGEAERDVSFVVGFETCPGHSVPLFRCLGHVTWNKDDKKSISCGSEWKKNGDKASISGSETNQDIHLSIWDVYCTSLAYSSWQMVSSHSMYSLVKHGISLITCIYIYGL